MDRFLPVSLGSWGRFITSGAFNTLVTYLLYLALLRLLPYQASYTIAYASGIALAYAMNRYLVFRRPGGRAGPLLVTLIYVGQYVLNLAIVSAAVHWFHAPPALAPLFAIAMTVPLTYLLNRRVFSGPEPEPDAETAALATADWRGWARRGAVAILFGLPLLSLALNAIAWLRFGVDLPFFDDWRAYDSGDIDSLEPGYLFQALNDTLTPVGLALDAVAQRLLDGNSIAYQFLSMVLVLGALLFLQWKLLKAALGDSLRAAACFVFALLMLQPGSYWGRENLAYQQALPLVFILAALWLAVARPWRDHWNVPAIFSLGLLSGFTYISGAFGAFAAGFGFTFMALLAPHHPRRVHLLRAGGALTFAGAFTAVIQYVVALLPSQGETHVEGKPLALPTEPDFWLYLLGKVGRSLMLPADRPVLSLVVVLLAIGVVVAVSAFVVRAVRKPAGDAGPLLPFACVFGGMAAMVATYLMLVAAGRTYFRPPEVQAAMDVFAFGFQRFHFFWATLLWPWVAAAACFIADRRAPVGAPPGLRRSAMAACVGLGVALVIGAGALDHFARQRHEMLPRLATAECLQGELQAGGPIRCPEWHMQDLRNSYIYARHIHASFVERFPIFPIELGVDSPTPWFRLGRDRGVQARNMVEGPASVYRGDRDAQMYLDIGRPQDMANCVMLDVRGRVKASQADTLTVYYREPRQREFTQIRSRAQQIVAGPDSHVFSVRLDSAVGFAGTLRIDPAISGQPFEVSEVEVRCRLSRPDQAGPTFYAMTRAKDQPALERLLPTGGGPGRYKAGDLPKIEFRTGQSHNMATCSDLEVEAIYRAERADVAQVFFRPRGVPAFSEADSVSLPVDPLPKPEPLRFVFHSDTGFEDQLRLDPVKRAQELQFVNVSVRCVRRVVRRTTLSASR